MVVIKTKYDRLVGFAGDREGTDGTSPSVGQISVSLKAKGLYQKVPKRQQAMIPSGGRIDPMPRGLFRR